MISTADCTWTRKQTLLLYPTKREGTKQEETGLGIAKVIPVFREVIVV